MTFLKIFCMGSRTYFENWKRDASCSRG